MTDHVRSIAADGVLRLVLNRGDKKNALTGAMYAALADGLDRAMASDAIRSVLITGEGDSFCAGNDVADFLRQGAVPVRDTPSARFIRALAGFIKPLVAAVQGNAVGIGTTMLLHCDLVYASPDARFSTPFSRLGLVPEAGSSLLLPRRIGPARANAMLLLGESMEATTALAAGLVNAILPADALAAHAVAQASALAALPPAALAASKQLIAGDRAVLAARIEQELDQFAIALRSDEAQAAFTAFLSRPRP